MSIEIEVEIVLNLHKIIREYEYAKWQNHRAGQDEKANAHHHSNANLRPFEREVLIQFGTMFVFRTFGSDVC